MERQREPAQVICLGEALVDRLGPLGGDPAMVPPDECDDRLGGAPANVACGLARLGTPVAFVGRLGRDAIGRDFAALFRERGLDTTALQWDPERPSRVVLVRRDAGGDRSFGGFTGDRGAGFADQALDAAELAAPLEALVSAAAWVLMGTIPLATPRSAEALQLVLERAAAHGLAIALDVNWRPTFWDPRAPADAGPPPGALAALQPLLRRASLLKLAAEEAQWLFASRDPAQIQASLPQRPAVVVTDGGAPLAWSVGNQEGSLPAFAVDVVDTTGAGDAFTAGLLHRFCAEPGLLAAPDPGRLRAAMAFAGACGALVCRGAGAIDPQPSAAEVEGFLALVDTESLALS